MWVEIGLLVRRRANRCTPLDSSSAAARIREAGQSRNKEKRRPNKTEAGKSGWRLRETQGQAFISRNLRTIQRK